MGHMLCICLASVDKSKQYSEEVVPIYTPTSGSKKFEFLARQHSAEESHKYFILFLMISKNLFETYD